MNLWGGGLKGDCDACGVFPAVGVCNCILAQPISVGYCARCLREGIEAWWIMVGTAASCGGTKHMAEWALDICRQSLKVHGKTWEQFESDVAEMMAELAQQGE